MNVAAERLRLMARVTEERRVGVAGMTAERVALAPGARHAVAAAGETLVYVVRGNGVVAGAPLARESVVWLEPGDEVTLEAGADGLELLVGAASSG